MKKGGYSNSQLSLCTAFADASTWRKVIPLLEKDGFNVTAVQNPLKSDAWR
jgi:hypothetical protein